MQAFDAAGVAVYALSYDEPDALNDFANAHNITFTLLSDPDSLVIKAFGLLNTLIDPNDHPWYGIPYPGSYILNAQGTITHKFFESNLAVRAGPEQLLRAVNGQPLLDTGFVASTPKEVEINVALDGDTLALTVQRDLVISLHVPEGRHVYAHPAPEGMVPLSVSLEDNEHLVQRTPIQPPSLNHRLANTAETFAVHDGLFELRLPLTLSSIPKDLAEITVAGVVRWQCCDDEVCDVPAAHRFELMLPTAASPPPALAGKAGPAREPNAKAHFQRMIARREGSR